MPNKLTHALKRADRAVASAFCLMLASAGACLAYAPYAEQSAPAVTAQPRALAAKVVAAAAQPAPVPVAKTAQAAPELHATPASFENDGMPALGPSQEELLAQVFLQQGECLANALYYEARGESRAGQMAIAEVVYNRMRSGYYPRTICGIVYEGARLRTGCQFSFTCDGEMLRPKSPVPWRRAERLALQIVTGLVKLGDTTMDATSYHATEVQPVWSGTMERTVQIGNHIFYRPIRRTFTRGA